VKPYAELTDIGKLRRLRGLADEALTRYDLEVRRIRLIALQRNTTFRVDTTDRRTFALRIGAPPSRSEVDVGTELAWLDALARDPLISAARPIRNRKRLLMTPVWHEGVPEQRTCVLFEWMPGQPIGELASPVDYEMLGELAASLHEHGARWKPGRRRLRPLVWDRVFYYPDEPVVLYDGRFRRVMTPERTEVIKEVEARAAKELTRLHKKVPLIMLHGGLQPWNVHLHGGRLHVRDFENVMLGAPVQDLAITLFHSRPFENYDNLLSSFVDGYRSVREWPVEYEGQVLLLMAARSVMLINYILRMGFESEEFVATSIEQMKHLV
jgi:Ser/Thr protein kinase RdoA (MazF antagonist)